MTVQVRACILRNEPLSGSVWRLSADAPALAGQAEAGQFLTVRAGETTDPLLRRPFGIHRLGAVEPGSVDVLYQVVGKGTRAMTRMRAGETVDLLGPIGRGFPEFPDKREHWLVAGGIGIAPFPVLARRICMKDDAAKVRLFYGGRTAEDLVGTEEIFVLADEAILTTEDGGRGEKGLITGPLRRYLADADPREVVVYACGPLPMLRAVAKLATEAGAACRVSLESQMACGFGTCMGCVTRTIPIVCDEGGGVPATCDPCADGGVQECYQRICTDGPVFDAREIVWGDH